MKVAVILFNVDLSKFDLSSYYTIGVDKGALNACKSNIRLNLAVGDFDSVSEDELNLIRENSDFLIKLNPIKDDTDSCFALDKAYSLSDEVTMFGGIYGNRIEHFMSNILSFSKYPNLKIVDNNSLLFMKDSDFTINRNEYKYISFFSLNNDLKISLKGFKYNLDNYNLKVTDPLCISNEIIEDTAYVSINGKTLVILSKNDN